MSWYEGNTVEGTTITKDLTLTNEQKRILDRVNLN